MGIPDTQIERRESKPKMPKVLRLLMLVLIAVVIFLVLFFLLSPLITPAPKQTAKHDAPRPGMVLAQPAGAHLQ